MNKPAKKPSLFDQALAIAIDEGKAESSKDADPLQSGIVGENYLLYSKERKLLISIPLEKLKRNTRKKSDYSNSSKWTMGLFVFTYGFLAYIALSRFHYYQVCDKGVSVFNSFALLFSSFFVVHWLALKTSQYIGLRDKKITFLRDRSTYWIAFFLLLQFAVNLGCDSFR